MVGGVGGGSGGGGGCRWCIVKLISLCKNFMTKFVKVPWSCFQ